MNYPPYESPTRKRRSYNPSKTSPGLQDSPQKQQYYSPGTTSSLLPSYCSPLKAPKSPVKASKGSPVKASYTKGSPVKAPHSPVKAPRSPTTNDLKFPANGGLATATPPQATTTTQQQQQQQQQRGKVVPRAIVLGVGLALTLLMQCNMIAYNVPAPGGGLRVISKNPDSNAHPSAVGIGTTVVDVVNPPPSGNNNGDERRTATGMAERETVVVDDIKATSSTTTTEKVDAKNKHDVSPHNAEAATSAVALSAAAARSNITVKAPMISKAAEATGIARNDKGPTTTGGALAITKSTSHHDKRPPDTKASTTKGAKIKHDVSPHIAEAAPSAVDLPTAAVQSSIMVKAPMKSIAAEVTGTTRNDNGPTTSNGAPAITKSTRHNIKKPPDAEAAAAAHATTATTSEAALESAHNNYSGQPDGAAQALMTAKTDAVPARSETATQVIATGRNDEGAADPGATTVSVVTARRFAYTYVVGGCDPDQPVYRNFLYNVLVNTHLMRQDGSKGEVIVFVQMKYSSSHKALPKGDLRLLAAMHVKIQYIPSTKDECFEQLMMEKFRILGLTDYDSVVFLDADILLRGSLDYLLELSMQGTLKKNIVFAGRFVPAAGGLFIVSPGNRDNLLEILGRTDRNASRWDLEKGWGQAFEDGDSYELLNGKKGFAWDFPGASMDQGLIYHWAKFEEKSVSIVLKNSIQNWDVGPLGKVRLEKTLTLDAVSGFSTAHSCWDAFMNRKPCTAPHRDFLNFPGSSKPWLHLPPADFSALPEESPSHFWFHTLSFLNEKLKIGLDFEHWQVNQRPMLGYQPSNSDVLPKSIAAVPHIIDTVTLPTNDTVTLPTKARAKTKAKGAEFAYAYVIGGCDPTEPAYRNFINNVLINTHLQREEGSIADVVVFFQMSYDAGYEELPDRDVRVLTAMHIKILYIPKTKHETFERLMFDKFRVLGLTQYKRVLYMDSDIMVRGSLDYMFRLSLKGIIKENLVLVGRFEPAMGGLFMVAPKVGDWDRILEIIRVKEERGAQLPFPHWDEVKGWGHEFNGTDTYEMISGKKENIWDFAGASSDQGLLYSWIRFEKKSVSIVMKDTVQNWGIGGHNNVYLEDTLGIAIFTGPGKVRECWTASLNHKPCVPPHSDYIHFPGLKKPWLKSGPPADLFSATEMSSPTHFWFRTLTILNDKLELGLNFAHWENNLAPLLGVRPHSVEIGGTTYAESASKKFSSPYTTYIASNGTSPRRFAYAYVNGGCKPEDPSYRNYFNDIIISTYLQREEGSTADVVVFVQMAYESSFDTLPEADINLLRAADVIIKYIPKAEDESFYRIMLDKFRVLSLTQYERVLFMDGDVLARGSLDYLFELSVKGVLKKNLIFAGASEPSSGGFFMLAPSKGSTDRVMEIIREKEERGANMPFPHWNETVGWGHAMEDENDYIELYGGGKKSTWDFYGAFADQGLLYHWVKYEEKSVSIVMRDTIQNWDVVAGQNGNRVQLEATISLDALEGLSVKRECWKEVMMHKPCVAPHSDFVHFTGSKKPWLRGPPDDLLDAAALPELGSKSPSHFWFYTLSVLNDKMQIGLDFKNWKSHHRPTLGMWPTQTDAATTKYVHPA